MKSINVTELKAHLSEYLRLASRGTRIVVKDRDEPVAQLGPIDKAAATARDRLSQQGRLRRGSQKWSTLAISACDSAVDIQAALREVREESQ